MQIFGQGPAAGTEGPMDPGCLHEIERRERVLLGTMNDPESTDPLV